MGILAWIVLGAIASWSTNLIMGGGEGVIATIILGIVGAVVGGYLAGTVLKVADVTGLNVESIVVAVIGGVVVGAVYRLLMGPRTTAWSPPLEGREGRAGFGGESGFLGARARVRPSGGTPAHGS